MGIEYETLAAANKYTEDTIIGQGAIKGDKGDPGPKGDPGEGIAAGGTTGQVLVKSSNADYATEWKTVGNTKALETGIDLIAHRGLYGNGIPENTIAALLNAFTDGFRWVEVDIMRSQDDVWVLSHNPTVTLYKNGTSESVTIGNKTFAELQEYTWDANGQYKVDSFARSLYELKKYNMNVIVDVKGEFRTSDVCNIVADYGMQKHCYVSTSATHVINHAEELESFKDITFRILADDYSKIKQVTSLVENPIVLDVNSGRWNDILPIALALRLPIICADFTTMRTPENRKGVINVVSGVMDMDNVTFDVLKAGIDIPVDYSEITITESDGVCASSEQTATLHVQNNVENGGFINLYTENPEVASLVQNTRGTNVNATITAVSDGVTLVKAINGSIVNSIPVNVSMNGFYGFLGDITDGTMKYTFAGNKISLFAGNGDANMDFEIVKVRRFEYSDIGYYGKAFYIPEVPEGATKLHVSIDTTKASASIYVKTYSEEKVKLQSYSWQSDREITLTSDEKYYAIGLRYNDARQLQDNGHVTADFVTLLDALSIEFT